MVRWQQETDLDLLRQAGELLERENARLVQKVLDLTQQLLRAQGKDKEELQLRLAQLEADLAQQRKKLFGDSSEKRPRERETKERPKHPGHGPRPQPALPIEEVPHTLTPDEAGRCSLCKDPLAAWAGQFETGDEVDVVTRHFVIKRHKRQKYRCPCGSSVLAAPGPEKLADGARYSLAFVAEVVVGKYLDHLPLERMVRIFGREGLVIDSQTLWDQCNAAASLLAPAYARLREWVLSFSVVGADETWWRLMSTKTSGGSTKRWYVWALGVEKGVYYRLFDDRSKEAARQLLDGYVGTVMCDGYSSYEALAKSGGSFVLAHCWAHVRRKFVECEAAFPRAAEALSLIGTLYALERLCERGPAGDDERAVVRDAGSRAVIDELRAWALATYATTLPEGGLGKAIAYMTGMWSGLVRFLDDPRIPIDNNHLERSLRGPVVGRKNHYGSRSQRGTEVAALLYSLVETAKLCGVDPKRYLATALRCARRSEPIPLPHELRPDDPLTDPPAEPIGVPA